MVPIVLCGHWLATIDNPCNSIGLLVAFQRLKPLDPIYCLANGLPPLKTKAINLLERGGFSLFVDICQFTKVAEDYKPVEYLPYFTFHYLGIFQYSWGIVPHRTPIHVVIGAPIDVEQVKHGQRHIITK